MTLNTYSTISELIEKLYDDYLYDCYVANQRLTEEDWLYFGCELHHVVIPDRDQGEHGPLNSQYLTTYQHWVAGVLQSELLGKCCFAFVPARVLPDAIEKLRLKWHNNFERTFEERSLISKKFWNTQFTEQERHAIGLARWENWSEEELSEKAKKHWRRKSAEERSEISKRRWAAKTEQERSNIARQRMANLTPEERSERVRKAWETRRRKAQEQ